MKIGRIEIHINKKVSFKERVALDLNELSNEINENVAKIREQKIKIIKLEAAVAEMTLILDKLTK